MVTSGFFINVLFITVKPIFLGRFLYGDSLKFFGQVSGADCVWGRKIMTNVYKSMVTRRRFICELISECPNHDFTMRDAINKAGNGYVMFSILGNILGIFLGNFQFTIQSTMIIFNFIRSRLIKRCLGKISFIKIYFLNIRISSGIYGLTKSFFGKFRLSSGKSIISIREYF